MITTIRLSLSGAILGIAIMNITFHDYANVGGTIGFIIAFLVLNKNGIRKTMLERPIF